MTAADRLQAAINKMEALREKSVGGRWAAEENLIGQPVVRAWFDNAYNGNTLVADLNHDDGELIVTLHRTIDAQLSVLAYGATVVGEVPEPVLALADAILGVDS